MYVKLASHAAQWKRIRLLMLEMRVRSLGQEHPLEWEWQPIPVFLLGDTTDKGAWRASVHRVAKE